MMKKEMTKDNVPKNIKENMIEFLMEKSIAYRTSLLGGAL